MNDSKYESVETFKRTNLLSLDNCLTKVSFLKKTYKDEKNEDACNSIG